MIVRRSTALVLLAALAACQAKEPARANVTDPPVAASAPSVPAPAASVATPAGTGSIHRFTMKRLDGTPESLASYAGKVLLVVNTASECGYTPQYEGLEALHDTYQARGFAVLGFPSNDFGGQEPGSSKEIATFCRSKYGIKFPMFEKVVTTGPNPSPLYALLASSFGAPQWNFHKYLVDKKGIPVKAWPSATRPDSAEIAQAIEAQLATP